MTPEELTFLLRCLIIGANAQLQQAQVEIAERDQRIRELTAQVKEHSDT